MFLTYNTGSQTFTSEGNLCGGLSLRLFLTAPTRWCGNVANLKFRQDTSAVEKTPEKNSDLLVPTGREPRSPDI